MTIPTLLLTPRRAALLAGHDNELDVLVRVQAPVAPAGTPPRHALHLALVLDRSGSMAGEPLEYAKRCAEFMLDGLHDPDRLSVVVFDNQVSTLAQAGSHRVSRVASYLRRKTNQGKGDEPRT